MSTRSYLGKYQPNGTPPSELREMKIEAWRQPEEDRSLLIGPEDFKRLTPIERQVAIRIGDKLFGRVINGR